MEVAHSSCSQASLVNGLEDGGDDGGSGGVSVLTSRPLNLSSTLFHSVSFHYSPLPPPRNSHQHHLVISDALFFSRYPSLDTQVWVRQSASEENPVS